MFHSWSNKHLKPKKEIKFSKKYQFSLGQGKSEKKREIRETDKEKRKERKAEKWKQRNKLDNMRTRQAIE